MTLSLILCVSLAAPQQPPAQSIGQSMGWPFTFVIDGQTAAANPPLGDRYALYKEGGFRHDQPGLHPVVADRPDLVNLPWTTNPNVRVNAISFGFDPLRVDKTTGTAHASGAGSDGWAGLLVGLAPAPPGTDRGAPGSVFRREHDAGDAAADVFELIYWDSHADAIHPDLLGAHRSNDSSQIRLVSGSPGSPDPSRITGLDPYAPHLLGEQWISDPLLSDFDGVVFSVDDQTIGNVSGWWYHDEAHTSPVDPAHRNATAIFRSNWDPASGWGSVWVYRTGADLELDPDDDVTALAWDRVEDVLVYASKDPDVAPLMVYTADQYRGPLLAEPEPGSGTSTEAWEVFGMLRTDRVSFVAGIDPRDDNPLARQIGGIKPAAVDLSPVASQIRYFCHTTLPPAPPIGVPVEQPYAQPVHTMCMTMSAAPVGPTGSVIMWRQPVDPPQSPLPWQVLVGSIPVTGPSTVYSLDALTPPQATEMEIKWVIWDLSGTPSPIDETPPVRFTY